MQPIVYGDVVSADLLISFFYSISNIAINMDSE